MTELAYLIAKFEGFFKDGSIPQRRNNPGDLRHSPHSSHDGIGPDDIGIIDTIEHGWEDLERQLGLYASRGMSLEGMISVYAPSSENDNIAYLQFICQGLDLPKTTLVSIALEIQHADSIHTTT